MIDHHAKMTRLLAEQLGLADAVLDGVGAAYERWDGQGWPGSAGGEDIPVPSRIAQLRRVRRGGAPRRRGRGGGRAGPRAQREAVRPEAGRAVPEGSGRTSWPATRHGSDLGCRDRGRAGPGHDGVRRGVRRQAVCCRQLRRSQVAVHARTLGCRRWPCRRRRPGAEPSGRATSRLLRRAGLVLGFGRLGVSNAIWDKPGAARAGRVGAGADAALLHRADAADSRLRWRRWVRWPPSTASAWMARAIPGASAARSISPAARVLGAADAYQAMREPRPHRASPVRR